MFLGDGTLGEGVVYETLNLASLWSLPVCFVVEDNGIAQTTDTSTTTAGTITDRASAFGLPVVESDTTDVLAINELARDVVERTRLDGPMFWHLRTVRLAAHSKGDDTRSPTEILRLRQRDPLALHRSRIEHAEEVEERCRRWLQRALELATAAPVADGSSMR